MAKTSDKLPKPAPAPDDNDPETRILTEGETNRILEIRALADNFKDYINRLGKHERLDDAVAYVEKAVVQAVYHVKTGE